MPLIKITEVSAKDIGPGPHLNACLDEQRRIGYVAAFVLATSTGLIIGTLARPLFNKGEFLYIELVYMVIYGIVLGFFLKRKLMRMNAITHAMLRDTNESLKLQVETLKRLYSENMGALAKGTGLPLHELFPATWEKVPDQIPEDIE